MKVIAKHNGLLQLILTDFKMDYKTLLVNVEKMFGMDFGMVEFQINNEIQES